MLLLQQEPLPVGENRCAARKELKAQTSSLFTRPQVTVQEPPDTSSSSFKKCIPCKRPLYLAQKERIPSCSHDHKIPTATEKCRVAPVAFRRTLPASEKTWPLSLSLAAAAAAIFHYGCRLNEGGNSSPNKIELDYATKNTQGSSWI